MGWGCDTSPVFPASKITPFWLRDLLYFYPLMLHFDHF